MPGAVAGEVVTRVAGAAHTLEQHNQILLSAIIASAEDVLREMGRIGQRLESVWLLGL